MSINESLFNNSDFTDHEPYLTVVSNGNGQDSAAIIHKLVYDKDFRKKYAPNELLILFADTHEEHPYTYDYSKRVITPLCKKHNINYVHITNDMGFHGQTWLSLSHQWANNRPTIGSVAYPKTCTHNLKLAPQYRYVEKYLTDKFKVSFGRKEGYKQFARLYGKIRWIIGIAKGEESRVNNVEIKEKWKNTSIETIYPLIEIGYTRQGCQNYLKSINVEIPFPSNCMKCPFGIGAFELLWLKKSYPEKFEEWATEEQRKLEEHKNYKRNLGVSGKLHKDGDNKGNAITLIDLAKQYEKKYPDITLDQLNEFKFSHGHCVTSKY